MGYSGDQQQGQSYWVLLGDTMRKLLSLFIQQNFQKRQWHYFETQKHFIQKYSLKADQTPMILDGYSFKKNTRIKKTPQLYNFFIFFVYKNILVLIPLQQFFPARSIKWKHQDQACSSPFYCYFKLTRPSSQSQCLVRDDNDDGSTLHCNALLNQVSKNQQNSLVKNLCFACDAVSNLLWLNASKDSRIGEVQSEAKLRIHNLLKKVKAMCKYTKVYMRNKKQSNISLPLRFSLLRSIFVQNMSVKDAAAKWRIHYSSAKIIARTARRNRLYSMFDREFPISTPKVQCTYQDLSQVHKAVIKSEEERENTEERESEHSNSESLTHFSQAQSSKIEIHSTVGWTYLAQRGLSV